MPRYYFHVYAESIWDDPVGIELCDLATARQEAIYGLRDLIAEEVKLGRLPKDEHIVIADDLGEQLSAVRFDDAIQILKLSAS